MQKIIGKIFFNDLGSNLEKERRRRRGESEPQTSVLLTEDTGQELISLLSEVKEMLSEMCNTGTVGVSMVGPGPNDEGPSVPKRIRKKLRRK